ncbi:MAG: hypothetical protein KJ645_04165 [Planctomycetes bacterium]|nr:hypothetical protein [Planctomycetota bacterium]
MHFLHCLSGEITQTVADYQKHYRSHFPHLIDPVRAFEKEFNQNGWPFYLIANEKGEVLYAESTLIDSEEAKIRSLLDQVALKKPKSPGSFLNDGYPQTVLKKNKTKGMVIEEYPCLVADLKGGLFLSFVRNEGQGAEVYLKSLQEGTGGKEIYVSEGYQDAYYATSIVDPENNVWIFFTALADSGKYDIFVRNYSEAEGLSAAVNVTKSEDDAMHPSAVVDRAGQVWLAYYGWQKMNGVSRDKEVFARFYNGSEWSGEIHVSPDDVPDYEDHTDPSITAATDGGVIVAWSWDMHETKIEPYHGFQTKYGAESPTIFGRKISAQGVPGEFLLLGHQGIDGAPELGRASEDRLWCAWNTLGFEKENMEKSMVAGFIEAGKTARKEQYVIESGAQNIDSPCLIDDMESPSLYWCSQDKKGDWSLKGSAFENGTWRKPATIEKKGDPRFLAAARSKEGRIVLAFSQLDGTNRKIAILEPDL